MKEMSEEKTVEELIPTDPSKLDGWVDLFRNVIVVGYVLLSAYSAFTSTEVDQFYWALIIVGGAIIYALFLPYKRAMLIDGEMGFIARARVARVIIAGIPAWIILSLILLLDPYLSQSLPLFLENPSSVDLSRTISLILLLMAIMGGFVFGIGLDKMLSSVGFEEDTVIISDYLKSHGIRDMMMSFFIILYAESFILSGWLVRENSILATNYIVTGLLYVVALVIYGFFYAWYIPERYTSDSRLGFEITAGFILLVSPIFAPLFLVFFVVVLGSLSYKTSQYPKKVLRKIGIEREKEIENSLALKILRLFFESNETFSKIYLSFLMLLTFGSYFLILLDLTEFLVMGIIFYGGFGVYGLIALIWILRKIGKKEETS